MLENYVRNTYAISSKDTSILYIFIALFSEKDLRHFLPAMFEIATHVRRKVMTYLEI